MRRLLALPLLPLLLAVVGACDSGEAPGAAAREASPPPDPREAPDGSRDGPETGLRVVFLGTSLTAGVGLDRRSEAYPARLGELADSAGVPIRVVNAGVGGETSAGGLRRLGGLLRDTVDVLFLELGANDGLRGHDPEALESNLRAIVRETRRRWPGARVVLAGLEAPPNLGPRYTAAFRAVFPRIAGEMEVPLVPFLLEGVAGVPALNQSDGVHPTAAGHARMARTAWEVLGPVLSDLASETGS